MKRIIHKLILVAISIAFISSCSPVNSNIKQPTENQKKIRLALIQYEMARNIILHKDYKNLSQAFTYLNQAKKVLNNDPRVYYMLAIAYKMRKNLDKYEENLKRAIQINPNFFDAYNGLGIYYFEKGQYKKALEIFTKLINNPLYPGADVAFFNRSRVYLKLKNIKAAEDDLKSAIIFSNYSNKLYYKNLISIQMANREYIKALETLMEMENRIGQSCYTITTKALCFIKLRDFKRAKDELNKIKDVSSPCALKKIKLLEEIEDDNNTNN
ncbi:tetratricopeptide repeat protein [Hippea maritima]|uniref:Tetratricopeptide TPR_1 repeat-containing protein n=1 Tax=Hippea maritima (strain ATCC 700847 / DSM 10411 / MH2) TaxID=760142 RepID=F2LXW8_HIPMA|nr:tetratricopeptide repeat protein [Hippea maritima]AEA33233.1 Tetratricopeptide TPR_1 repeat-containing protein [Hippea maritima DSM 10411]